MGSPIAEPINLAALRRECANHCIDLPERPNYQQTATALHKLVKKTRRSLQLLDPPLPSGGDEAKPMTVFAASDRRETPRPVKWPSAGLQEIRRSEANIGRSKKRKNKAKAALIEMNRRKVTEPHELPGADVAL